ncbi:MAG: porin [Duganella sp.]
MIIGGFAAQAQAQSNVTIYGLVDAGIVSERGGAAGNVTKVTSGIGGQSRIGFRGTEDLGGGLSAIFQLEAGIKVDDGALDNTNSALFNRVALLGLKSKDAGTLSIGRQQTMLYNVLSQVADPFGAGYAGTIKNLFPTSGNLTRVSNSLVYTTPTFSGFSVDGQYAFGEQAGSSEAARQFGLGLNYSQGGLNTRLVYNNRNNDTVAVGTTPAVERESGRNTVFAANYDFKVVKAYFAYNANKGLNSSPLPVANAFGYAVAPRASTDNNVMLVGAQIPVGSGNIMTSFTRKNDKTNFNQDADQWALGYLHTISKRTGAYVSYAKIKNKNGAGYTVGNNNEAGSGDKAFNAGIRHSF